MLADATSDAVAACCWNLYWDQVVAVSTAACCCYWWLLLSKSIVILLSRCWLHTAVFYQCWCCLHCPALLLAISWCYCPQLRRIFCPFAGLSKQLLLACLLAVWQQLLALLATTTPQCCCHCPCLLILLAINFYFAIAVAINYSCIVASDAAVPLLFTIAAANRLLLYFPFFDMAGALTASCAIFTAVAAPTAVTCHHHWLIIKL